MPNVTPLKVNPAGNKVVERFGSGDTVGVPFGGTGLATITPGALMVGNGTGNVALVGPGTTGQIPVSNGTTFVMTDLNTADVSGQTNANAGTLAPGTPVYEKTTANNIDKAQGNAIATSFVLGLTIASYAAAVTTCIVRTTGPLALTTAQWDAITGQTGGLSLGVIYYLDTATAGKLTTSPVDAAGNFLVPVGKSLSTTTMVLDINRPVGL